MLTKSSKDPDPGILSDPLSEMLRGLRLDGVEYGRFRMKAPWGLSFMAQDAARFHFVSGADCWLKNPAGRTCQCTVRKIGELVNG